MLMKPVNNGLVTPDKKGPDAECKAFNIQRPWQDSDKCGRLLNGRLQFTPGAVDYAVQQCEE